MKPVAVLFFHLTVGFIIIILGISLAFGFSPLDFFKEARLKPAVSYIYVPLLYGLILLTVNRRAEKEGMGGIAGLGLRIKELSSRQVLSAVIPALAMFAIYGWILLGAGAVKLSSSPDLNFGYLLTALVFSILFALVEEILFRGFILQSMLKSMKPWQAVAASGVLFALLHIFRPGSLIFKALYFTGIFSVGTVLSILYLKDRSLNRPVLLHSSWIFIMYLLPSIISPLEGVYEKSGAIWGMMNTPPAGLLGIGVILLTGAILYAEPLGSLPDRT